MPGPQSAHGYHIQFSATSSEEGREDGMSVAILSEGEREYAARLAREIPAVIDLDDLPRWIGMSRATIYRLRNRNRFPIRPLHPTTRRVQFAGIDVLRYLLRNRE